MVQLRKKFTDSEVKKPHRTLLDTQKIKNRDLNIAHF